MGFMQTESVLQTINRSEPAKNRFSVALQLSDITQNRCQSETQPPPGIEPGSPAQKSNLLTTAPLSSSISVLVLIAYAIFTLLISVRGSV